MGMSPALLIPYAGTVSSPLAIHPDLWLRPGSDTCFTGGCRTFNAADKSCFSVASSAAHNLGTGDAFLPFAVNRSATGNQVIMGKYQDANNYWRLEFTAAHKLHFIAVVGAATKIEITSTTAYSTTSAWIFGCVAIDRSAAANCKIYVYGADDTAGASTTSTDDIDNTGAMYVGQSGADTLYLAGSIASLAIGKPTDVTTVVAAAVASFYNLRNAKTYAELTDAEVTDYGIKCWYNGNETSTSANLIDQHDAPGDGSNDLVKTHATLVTNGDFATGDLTGWTNHTTNGWDVASAATGALNIQANNDGSPVGGVCIYHTANLQLTSGRVYSIAYDIVFSGNACVISVAESIDPSADAAGYTRTIAGNVSETTTFTAAANAKYLKIWRSNDATSNHTLDNFVLKATTIAVGNGPAEAIASDSVGTNHATLTGFTPAQLISALTTDTHNGEGYALTLDGVGNYLSVATSAALNITGDITISAWVRTNVAGSLPILGFYNTASPYNGYGFRISSGKIGFWNGTAWIESNSTVNDGTWKHIAVSISGGTATFYVGSVADGTPASAALASYTGARAIGSLSSGTSAFFPGSLDDARIYNVGLTPAQVSELYTLDEDEEVTGATAVAQWRFDDGPFGQPGDEDPILSWLSGDGDRYLLYQTTAASRPSYELLGVNSLPALDFDGTDYLYIASTTAARVALPTVLIVAAADDPTTASVQVLLSIQDDASANNFLYFGIDTNGKFVVAGNDAGTTFSVTGDTVLDTAAHMLEATWDGTNWHLKVDGVDETETRAGTECGPTDIDNMDSTTVGACYTNGAAAGASLHFAGLIADMTVKSSMSEGLLLKLERHYASRYGL